MPTAISMAWLIFVLDSELVSRRRLGQTTLKAKPGFVGTSNALKSENLGLFEYAHLKIPLPDNLKGSEIFAPQPLLPHPKAYFLMVRWKVTMIIIEDAGLMVVGSNSGGVVMAM